MNKILAIFTATMALGLLSFNAEAKKGEQAIYESPMIAVNGSCDQDGLVPECDGSESKIERDGDWKVEIEGVENGDYEVCLKTGNDTVFLQDITVDDGELKATEPLHIPNDTYTARFVVTTDNGDNDCSGQVQFKSGFVLNNP